MRHPRSAAPAAARSHPVGTRGGGTGAAAELPRRGLAPSAREPRWRPHWDLCFGWHARRGGAQPADTGAPVERLAIFGIDPSLLHRIELADGSVRPFVVDDQWSGYRLDATAGEIVQAIGQLAGESTRDAPLVLEPRFLGLDLRWGRFSLCLGLEADDHLALEGTRVLAWHGDGGGQPASA